ncbi:alpha/beta hydrolase [Nocardia stercoris]|uniref:alpha/beta hydrolase n=1 Tax=Nocardia stercoris TaxID=2483361 RepID=UPI00389964AC
MRRLRAAAASAACAALVCAGAGTAVAAPPTASVDHVVARTDRWIQVFVDSPAMQRIVQVDVLLPPDRDSPHPTLYLLDGDGADPTQTESTWTMRTDAVQFFGDKPVNVVLPVGGGGTFYSDWQRDDPRLGHVRWETFLTQELPPLIDNTFHGNGRNAVAGLSMGGQAAMSLTFRYPSLYRSVASYSGCMYTAGVGQAYVRAAVAGRGGDADNMWGGITDPDWAAHDVSLHTDALRGKQVFISAGTDVPGAADLALDPSPTLPLTVSAAMAIEDGARDCTLALDAQLRLQGVPADVHYYLIGTHSWPYWQTALHDSWPTLAAGVTAGTE